MSQVPAVLVLEDGRIFSGTSFGAGGTSFGEAVFATGMTGYQETLTDPSYRRQVVVCTAPQIGNTGWVEEDNESNSIHVAGLVIRDLSPAPSNWRATTSLPAEMQRQGIMGIAGLDTRALTRHLRDKGAMRCGIFAGADIQDPATMTALVQATPPMAGADLTGEVTTAQPYFIPAVGTEKYTVACIDLGIKANTPRSLAERGVGAHVLPATATIDDIEKLGVDGVFLSNGPGDPATADGIVELTKQILDRRIPLFGICFGNQILGRALGFGTYKLKFGHRGLNQPVKDHQTGLVLVTAQNHGFAVDAPVGQILDTPYGRAEVGFTCLNDGVVEGLNCHDVPAFSVQFHPEAAAGPRDGGYLFDRFVDMLGQPSQTGLPTITEPTIEPSSEKVND